MPGAGAHPDVTQVPIGLDIPAVLPCGCELQEALFEVCLRYLRSYPSSSHAALTVHCLDVGDQDWALD